MTPHAKMAISDSHGTLAWDDKYKLDNNADNIKKRISFYCDIFTKMTLEFIYGNY